MSFRIQIKETQNLSLSKGYIFVQGSLAGNLVSQQVKRSGKVPKEFEIQCNENEHLTFKLAASAEKYEAGAIGAKAEFTPAMLIKAFKNGEEVIEHTLDMFVKEDDDQKQKGSLLLTIKYEKVLKYEGEVEKSQISRKKKIGYQQFYKGVCPKTNLFSMFDPKVDRKNFRFVESYCQEDIAYE